MGVSLEACFGFFMISFYDQHVCPMGERNQKGKKNALSVCGLRVFSTLCYFHNLKTETLGCE